MASKEKPSLEQRWKDTDSMNLRWAHYYIANEEKYGRESLMVRWAHDVIARLSPEANNGR